jgi:sensor histidine kinase YesM
MKQFNKRLVIKILYHLAGWFVFFSINYFLIRTYPIRFNPYYQISIWVVSIIVFYVNYAMLMPWLLYKKRIIIYLAFSILLIASALGSSYSLTYHTFRDKLLHLNLEEGYKERISLSKNESGNIRPSGRVNMLWIYSTLLFFASGTALSLVERWSRDQKNLREREREKILAELTYLKNQVNPHFLFNSLNSIYSLSIQKSGKTTESILKLSNLLRYMIYETESELVPLQKEFDYISDYIELQKLRITGKTEVNYSLPNGQINYSIEPLLLIPVIENAFKYGVDNTKSSQISLRLEMEGPELILNSFNDIVKTKVHARQNESGLGLANLRRRLEILYPGNHIFEVTENQENFSALIRLNLNK